MFDFINIDKHTLFLNTIHAKWFLTILHIAFFWGVVKFANFFIDKFVNKICKYNEDIEFKKQLYTLKSIVKSIADIVIIAFAVMFILNNLGIDIRPILTAAGVLGVAVSFGAKRFFEDIITGFSLLLEGQVRVGDYIEIAGHEGTVEKADIKMIKLRDLQGRVHYIRNGMVDIITNYTRDYSYYIFDIGVAYKENIENVIDVIKDLGQKFYETSECKQYILAPLEILGLDKFDDSAVIIKARFKTTPIKQWEVGRAFNKCIKERFDELGIEIPFPQRTIHIEKEN